MGKKATFGRIRNKPTDDIHDVASIQRYLLVVFITSQTKKFFSLFAKNRIILQSLLLQSQSIYSNVIEFRRDITIGHFENNFSSTLIKLMQFPIRIEFSQLFHFHFIWMLQFYSFSENVIKFSLLYVFVCSS